MTLVELLVALALVGLLTLMLFDALKRGARVWQLSHENGSDAEEMVSAQIFLRGRLSHLDPSTRVEASALRRSAVEGAADEVAFSAPLPQSGDRHGVYRYRLFTRQAPTGQSLLVAWRLDHGEPDATGGIDSVQTETLVDHIRSVAIDYYDRPASGTPRWTSSWRSQLSPPALVRIRVSFDETDRRYWPDLIVRPRLTAGASCAFDAVSRRCRI
jgi:general secretion pathway protein J